MGWFYTAAVLVLIFGFVVFRGAPYVPSHRRYVKRAFRRLYALSPDDVLVDIGSGDGVILRLAAERGARAIGYELNPVLVGVSKLLARGNANISTRLADFWLVDLPKETTIVYAFAVTRDIEKVATKLQETADAVGHEVWLMTYGAQVTSRRPVRSLQAHTLYLFKPVLSNDSLQQTKP